jgi:hypothetical protein
MDTFPLISRIVSRGFVAAVTVAASTTLSACVGGLSLCIPQRFGEAPNFWADGRPPPYSRDANDPRWTGAVTFPVGGPTWVGMFRALHSNVSGGDSVVLSWHVDGDAELTFDDVLYVGFTQATAGPVVIEVQPFGRAHLPSSTEPWRAVSANRLRVWKWTGTSWVHVPEVPGWLASGTRVWGRFADDGHSWGVQMVIPVRRTRDPE